MTIKVGSTVRVTNIGRTCDTYGVWAVKHGLNEFQWKETPKTGDVGKVIVAAPHTVGSSTIIYGIEIDGKHFIMCEDGIEVAKLTSLPDVFTFEAPSGPYRMTKKDATGYICTGVGEAYQLGNASQERSFWATERILGCINDGIWTFLEDITPKLPRKFRVKVAASGNRYNVDLDAFSITGPDGESYYIYTESEVKSYIDSGVWVVVKEPTAKELAEQAVAEAEAEEEKALEAMQEAVNAYRAAVKRVTEARVKLEATAQ